MPKKNVVLWGLYDFANSVIQITVLLYLSQWLVVDNGLSELAYGAIFSISTAVLLISSPFVGVYIDRLRTKLPALKVLTVIIAVLFLALGYLTLRPLADSNVTLGAVIVLALIVNVIYQTSLTFFASLIPGLGKRSEYGKISGWGEFFNNAGLVFGILLTLPIVSGKVSVLGITGRSAVFLPAGLAFVLLTFPFFRYFVERARRVDTSVSLGLLMGKTKSLLVGLPKFPQMMWFLIGFYFVSDAVRTVFLFFPVYFEKVWGIPDEQKGLLTLGIIAVMMFGAVAFGQLADKYGTRKVLVRVVGLMVVTLLMLLPYSRFGMPAAAMLVVIALLWGGYFGVSRAMLVKLAPAKQVGEYLGLYVLFERFASVVAPLVWGGVISVTSRFGVVTSYRYAALSSALIILIGWYFLRKSTARV